MLHLSVLPSSSASWDGQGKVTPLQKVVEMLDGMVKTAKEEKHQEQLQYAGFQQFCGDVQLEKEAAIEQGEQQVELLKAEVQKHGTDAQRLATEIAGHTGEMSSLAQQIEDAKVVRDTERQDYVAMRLNLTDSVDALAKAIVVLKNQNYEREGFGPTALLEARSMIVHVPKASSVFQAFLVQEPDDDLKFVPAVPTTAYKPRSGEIIGMLEHLHDQFQGEIHELDKKETDRKHNFDVIHQDLAASSKVAATAKESKTESKAKSERYLADVTAELQDTSSTLADDTKYLEDLNATCQKKQNEYASRQQLRTEEIAALSKAIEIMKSNEISPAAKHLPAASLLARKARSAALVQVQWPVELDSNQLRAAAFLRDESKKLESHVLSTMALRVQDDPFGKVKQLIHELIERLKHQATAEAEHKGWCDTELATNGHTRKSKMEQVEMLRAEIDELSAKIAQLTKDLAELSTAIGSIEAAVANATDLRNAEKAQNAVTVAEAQNATAAVTLAMKVLSDYYAHAAANSTGLLQSNKQTQPLPPIFEDGSYSGQQTASSGVLGMLEVIRSDFQRLEADTTAAENAAQAEYDGFMEDSAISKAQKEGDVKHKTQAKMDNDEARTGKISAVTTAEGELNAALAEYEKLKPVCFDEGQTSAERNARRKDEIEALKEALRILSGEDVAQLLQQ